MSGAIPTWESKTATTTVKAVKKSGNVSDEDDEEGWEEMKKKRERKMSNWKTKKEHNGLQQMVDYTQ